MVHSKSDQDISGYNAEFEVFLYFYGESVFSIISIFCLMRFLYYRDLKCTKTFTRSWYCGWRRTPALQKHQTFPIHARQTPFCIFFYFLICSKQSYLTHARQVAFWFSDDSAEIMNNRIMHCTPKAPELPNHARQTSIVFFGWQCTQKLWIIE